MIKTILSFKIRNQCRNGEECFNKFLSPDPYPDPVHSRGGPSNVKTVIMGVYNVIPSRLDNFGFINEYPTSV